MHSRMWVRPFRQNGQHLHPVFSSWGTPVIDLFPTFANRKLPVFVSPFPDHRAKYVYVMPVLWSRMGMVYALLPFKMLPAVLNKIHSSHDLSVILIALVAHHGCQSYWSSLDVFPYHWKGIHFSHKKIYECPEVTSKPDITNPQIYMRGYSEGSVCQTWSQPRHCRSHQHQFEGLVDWFPWVPLEQIHRVLSEKCLKVFEVDSKSFSKYLLYLFEVDHYAPSTMISHWTSIASVLQCWKYDPATELGIRVLLHNIQLAWPVQQ